MTDVKSRNDFIKEDCFEKWGSIYTISIRMSANIIKIDYNFFVYKFSNFILYVILCYLLIKN